MCVCMYTYWTILRCSENRGTHSPGSACWKFWRASSATAKKKAPISLDPKPQPWKSQWERQLCDQHALKLIHPKRCKAMPYRSTRKKEKRKVLMTSRPCKCKRHCLACCDNTMMFAMPRSRTAHSSFKNRCPPASSLKPQWHPRLCKRWMRSVRAWRTSSVGGCSCGFFQRAAQRAAVKHAWTRHEQWSSTWCSSISFWREPWEIERHACRDLTPAKSERRSSCPSICTSPSSKVCCTKATLWTLPCPNLKSSWLGCSKKASTGSTGATWAMSCARWMGQAAPL